MPILQRMGARIELRPDRRFVIEGVEKLRGGEDYGVPLFETRGLWAEIFARVAAVLRRVRPALAGETLTYGQLAARSHQLAAALRAQGYAPETRVMLAPPGSVNCPATAIPSSSPIPAGTS